MKEKLNKKVILAMQNSFYKDFREICESQYKTVSEVIRDLMFQYIKEHKK